MINIFYRIVGSKRVALILDCIGIAFGAVIAAFAIEEFLVPCTILDGGVVGIGIMINSLAHIPLGILTIVFNIPFLAVGSRQLGKLFIVKSAFGMTVFSTFLQIFAPLRNVTNVLGVVRLDEARKHKTKAKEILADIPDDTDKETLKSLKQTANAEKQEYSQLKKLRWSLLTNGDKLSGSKTEHLQSILQDHHDLAVCYAMKEEICRLYTLKDYDEAVKGWTDWFEAAKESEIPALVKFAEQKEKRLPGLAAHAIYPISTGKLEGFNNKIKVAKRIGYGYRDDDFFFTLIRYLSIPSVRHPSHNYP